MELTLPGENHVLGLGGGDLIYRFSIIMCRIHLKKEG